MKRVVVGVTGSSAAYKAARLVSILSEKFEVKVVLTPSACKFVGKALFYRKGNGAGGCREVYTDEDWWNIPFLHLELAEADEFVIAPCTVNTYRKFASGITDNLLLAAASAFSAKKDVVIALSANENLLNSKNFVLTAEGCFVIRPSVGRLACGKIGLGRMVEPEEIAEFLMLDVNRFDDACNYHVVVTAGATKTYIDTVRYITNSSSGELGRLIALSAFKAGFDVTLVTAGKELQSVETLKVETASEMLKAVLGIFESARKAGKSVIYISTAAINDYRVKEPFSKKIKKSENPVLRLELIPEVDVLKEVFSIKQRGDVFVGFSLRDEIDEETAYEKMRKKGLDIVVANVLSNMGDGADKSFVARVLFTEGAGVDFAGTKLEFASFFVNSLIDVLK